MTLNKRASLLFLVALALYIGISFFLPTEGISYGASLALSAFAVSIPAFLIPAVVLWPSVRPDAGLGLMPSGRQCGRLRCP